MKQLSLFCLLFLGILSYLSAQDNTGNSTPRVLDFTTKKDGNAYVFTAITPPLLQKPGAPKAFWTYYWEFGDGSFSFQENPTHLYAKSGNVNPILAAVARYDDGKLPDKKEKGVYADASGDLKLSPTNGFDSTKLAVRMRSNKQPRALEEQIIILSYRNLGKLTTDGRLYLFFNEKKYANSHFSFDTARTHFQEVDDNLLSLQVPYHLRQQWDDMAWSATGEGVLNSSEMLPATIVDQMLATARAAYRGEKSWRFTGLAPNENRNMFFSMSGTANMIKDTSAFIHVEAIFAPFDLTIPPERFELEFEIVSSHDPNAIAVSDNRVSYRTLGNKKFDYKIKFQNNGEGPASKVELSVKIPKGLDIKKIKPVKWEPECPICPNKAYKRGCLDTATIATGYQFTFRNIYLPGSRQEGVEEYDSTKGMVKYRIEADKNMPKYSFKSQAKIVFDKNTPIYTNYTKTRFKIGVSPGLKVGYALGFGENPRPYSLLGFTIAPYKSWRFYPQAEILTGISGRKEDAVRGPFTDFIKFEQDEPFPDSFFLVSTQKSKSEFITIELPVQIRKSLNRFIAFGLGGSGIVKFITSELQDIQYKQTIDWEYDPVQGIEKKIRTVINDPPTSTSTIKKTRPVQYTAFADLTIGFVRAGPNIGIRGGYLLEKKQPTKPFVQLSLELKL